MLLRPLHLGTRGGGPTKPDPERVVSAISVTVFHSSYLFFPKEMWGRQPSQGFIEPVNVIFIS
jgi:hypothetical protein